MAAWSSSFHSPIRSPIRSFGALLALVAALGCASASPAIAQRSPARTRPLGVTGLAGQQISVLPITLVVTEPALAADSTYAAAFAPYRERREALERSDSLIGGALLERGPEVQWILPPELRKVARRSPGVVTDPDAMGQAMMRNPKLDEVPEPLRASLRKLVAVAGGRYVLIPAALGFGRAEEGGVRADLALVLTDARNGGVLWRSTAIGRGAAPDAALQAALAAVLPLDTSTP